MNQVPIGWNIVIYLISVLGVWFAGSRLAELVDEISERTGLGKAFAGFVLLAFATSFPEVVTSVATATIGEPDMIGSNMAGGVCLQTVILCAADVRYGRKALTGNAPNAGSLFGGIVLLLLISVALAGYILGDYALFGHVGVVGFLLVGSMLIGMRIMFTYEKDLQWHPVNPPEVGGTDSSGNYNSYSRRRLYGTFAAFTILIGVAGTLVSYTAESISKNWDINAGFAGASFIGISTSLPELSASLQAVKMKRASMAIGNIFGSNVFDISLLFLADLFYTQGALFNHFTKVTGMFLVLGAILTLIYLIGMLERRDRSYMRLGTDSIAVLILYIGGLTLSYFMS